MPGATAPTAALALPFTPLSARTARARLSDWLTGRDLPQTLVEDSRLVVSELIGNAVRHARPLPDGTMLVGWDLVEEGPVLALDLFVTDGGAQTRPHLVVNESADAFGRGLSIVDEVSLRWWYDASDDPEPSGTVHVLLPVA